jgi:hypothetical protein
VTVRRPVICLTPIKNEAWILERFLRCAALWADHIVIADQGSDDGSPEIAKRHAKVTLVHNTQSSYDEGGRQRLLIDEARRIASNAVLIALDADEILTANWKVSPEWSQVLAASPGTVIRLRWVNVLPDMRHGWMDPVDRPLGYADDGRSHNGDAIHSSRLPVPDGAPNLVLREIKALHYLLTDWERWKSKQRWYQCWERVNVPTKRPITLFRQYHHADAIPDEQVSELDPSWFDAYQSQGIDMTSVCAQPRYWWDAEVVALLATRGPQDFRKLDVWDVDWAAVAQAEGLSVHGPALADPRSRTEIIVHRWLRRTQVRSSHIAIRLVQRCLRLFGW